MDGWDAGTTNAVKRIPLLTAKGSLSLAYEAVRVVGLLGVAKGEGPDPTARLPPHLQKAGPRDGEAWKERLKQEMKALIAYVQSNKAADTDWFTIKPTDATGTKWTGKCWYMYNMLRYEFDLEFELPVTYPMTSPELQLPELDGKTAKMYRGGKICLTVHFKPLWAKNAPHFGIAHALCLGMGPWLAAEIPHLVDTGVIKHKG